ncbi:MAG: hypothetical protein DI537_43330 [Stutzerimonas stutzeri]|nr:MAG: hypothetical protein DI537_43330 [Stutzerimonas stutzeri]
MSDMTSSPTEIQAALDFVVDPFSSACGCMGPQGDEPLCPCAMRTVIRWKGVWINLAPVRGREPAPGYLDSLVDLSTIPVSEMTTEQRQQRLAQLRGGIAGQIKARG